MAKLLIAVGLLALVAAALAGDCCTGADRATVQRQWESVWGSHYDSSRADVAKAIFAEFFKTYPEAKALFQRVKVDEPDSAEWTAHTNRIISSLDICIATLKNPATLNAQLEHLSAQHVARTSLGFDKSYFDKFREPFKAILGQITSGFDAHAWDACYDKISTGLKSKF